MFLGVYTSPSVLLVSALIYWWHQQPHKRCPKSQMEARGAPDRTSFNATGLLLLLYSTQPSGSFNNETLMTRDPVLCTVLTTQMQADRGLFAPCLSRR